MYVIDTSVIAALHRNYFRSNFPSLWERLDKMVVGGRFTSVRESLRELEDKGEKVMNGRLAMLNSLPPPTLKRAPLLPAFMP